MKSSKTFRKITYSISLGLLSCSLFLFPSYIYATNVGQINFIDTQAFSGTSPTGYTDLDLSSIVGSNTAMVYLYVVTSGANNIYGFRPNGNSTNTLHNNANDGLFSISAADSRASSALVITDGSGVIEWMGNSATTTEIRVHAYIKSISITEGGGGSLALNDLTDVNISSASDNQSLTYDTASGDWINETVSSGGGASSLDDLDDVVITSATTDDILEFNGTEWVNVVNTGGGGSVTVESFLTEDQFWNLANENTRLAVFAVGVMVLIAGFQFYYLFGRR